MSGKMIVICAPSGTGKSTLLGRLKSDLPELQWSVSCTTRGIRQGEVNGREYHFSLLPQVDSGSPDIVLWSFRAPDWACDNAFVAAHNAAVRISTCAETNGYDVLSLAEDALKRIEKLANTTA